MESGVLCAVSCHYIVLDYSQTSEVDLFRSSPPSPPLLQVSVVLKLRRLVRFEEIDLLNRDLLVFLHIKQSSDFFNRNPSPSPHNSAAIPSTIYPILSYPILLSIFFPNHFFLLPFIFHFINFNSTDQVPLNHKKGHSLHTSLHFSCSSSHQKKLL